MKKSLGQNYLINEDAISSIVSSVPNISNFDLIEIGPGSGALTKHLYDKKYNNFYIIEKDSSLIKNLKLKYLKANIIEADAVDICYDSFLNTQNTNIMVANLPYYASSKILHNIINYYPMIDNMILMFQKEMADRIIAKVNTKDYSRITLMVEEFYDVSLLFDLDPSFFKPAPKVVSSVLMFSKKKKALICPNNRQMYQNLVDKAFMHRRKKIKYALLSFNIDISLFDNDLLDKRAGELSIFDYEMISNLLFKSK